MNFDNKLKKANKNKKTKQLSQISNNIKTKLK